MEVIKFMVYITCFCLYQDFIFCDDYGESGNEITLTPSIRGNPEEILWTHNGNKVLEYDGSEVAKYGSFKGRVNVDFETGQLTIRKLNSQDSGIYQSEIWINRKVQIASHTLTVLDTLPEPRVTCELDETSHLKKLSCSVESQTQPSYEWSGPDIKQPGPTLLVDEQKGKRDSVYTCTVKNKAASRTTDFTLQDCHTVLLAGGVSPSVLVTVIILAVLLIILLAALALYFYRQKKLKVHAQEAEESKLDPENGECDNLLRNVSTEAMPGSSDATLPCRTRLTAPKESIADKKWDHNSESENSGETHEGQKLLKASPQSAITEKNKEDTGITNEGELDKNERNSENADEAEENANSKPNEKDREIESQKSLKTQEEMEKVKNQILKNESKNEEKSTEKQIETLGDQKIEDADKNEDDQTPEDKKEKKEGNEEMDSPNTGECLYLLRNIPVEAMPGSSDATLPCRTRLTDAPKKYIADKKWDQDSGPENAGETHEGQNPLKESLQSAITKKNKEDTGNTTKGELDKNEKNSENADDAEEIAKSKPDEKDREIESQKSLQTQEEMEKEKSQILKNEIESENEKDSPKEPIETLGDQKTEDTNKYEEDQTPGEKKREEEENTVTGSPNTGECDNLLKNVQMEAMPGSSDGTLTAPKESIADKKWDQDSGSENAGETHEGQKLLKAGLQSAIPEKNKENTGNTNVGELDQNQKNSENADESEENINSKPDEKEKSQILKNESENEQKTHQEQSETQRKQETKDANKNEENQTPGEKKEKDEENKETDSPNMETVSPQAAVTERSTVDTGNVEEQLHTNEKNSQNENGEQSPEQQNKSPCTAVNHDDLKPEEKEEEKTGKENHDGIAEPCNPPLHTEAPSDPVDSPANLEKEPINISVPSSNQSALSNYTDKTQGEQTDPDSIIQYNNFSQQQYHNDGLSKQEGGISYEAVPACSVKSSIKDKNRDNKLIGDDAEIMRNRETNVKLEKKQGGNLSQEKNDYDEQRDQSNESEQGMKEKDYENNETKYNKHLINNKDETNNDMSVLETEDTGGSSEITEDGKGNEDDTPQQVKKDGECVLEQGVEK